MRETASAFRREQIRILLTALPAVVVVYLIAGRVESFSDRPWVVGLALVPLGVVIGVLGWPLLRDRRLLLGGGFLGFFVAYCVFFSIAAATRLMDGRRAMVSGFEAEAPSNVLWLSRLGDWHYWFAPPAPPANDLLVVTLPSFDDRDARDARLTQAELIRAALEREAKGIAFDYYVERASDADRMLCFWIDRAERAGVPVVYGYRVLFGADIERPEPEPMAPALGECIAKERQGTLTGLREADDFVRMVPTSHGRDTVLRSFSHRIANLLAGGAALTDVGLLQYVRPSAGPDLLTGMPDSAGKEAFRDHFVLVGSDRRHDVHRTPYGSVPGVLIHAFAAHSLRVDHYIRRLDALWLLPGIVLLCYLLTLLQSRGGGLRPLLGAAAVLSVAVAVAAAIAMRAGLVWIDTSYPLVAIWGLTGMLSSGAMLQKGRRVAVAPEPAIRPDAAKSGPAAAGAFDVFLSHNSKDDEAVRALALALRARELSVWLDEWELVPGRPWQQAIEEAIRTTASAAVLVGSAGIGPWEEPEMRACLDECVRRRMPVIPVLLPGAPEQPTLPLFLSGLTWVDLRDGISAAGLSRLEWGITGIKPRQSKVRHTELQENAKTRTIGDSLHSHGRS